MEEVITRMNTKFLLANESSMKGMYVGNATIPRHFLGALREVP